MATWRTVVALGLLVALTASPASAHRKDAGKRRHSYTVSEYAYRKLEKAQKLLADEKYDEARETLDKMAGRRRINPHERALMYQTYGYIESSQGHYKQAAASFEKCLAESAMPPAAEIDIQYNLAQLYLANEQFEKAVRALKDWFAKVEKPAPQAYYLLAVAYVRQEKVDPALAPAIEAVRKSHEPKEPWLQLLLSLYLQKSDYKKAVGLLEQLVARFPKKTYWKQLSAVYAELGKEEDSLAVMQLAYAQGLLDKDRELRNLARMYLYQELPYRAATVLENGLASKVIEADGDAWGLLADSWLSAREYDRALQPLKNAARLSSKGDSYVRLAQIYIDREDWTNADEALQAALKKPKLKDRGRALLLLGIANLSNERVDAAERAFEQAEKYEKYRRSAAQWLDHVRRKRTAADP